MVRRSLATLAAAAVLAVGRGVGAEESPTPVVLDDFGSDPLDRWKLANLAGSEASEGTGTATTASLGLSKSGGRAGWVERNVEQKDWRGFDSLRVRVSLDAAAPQRMRVVAAGEHGSLVRRFTLDPGPAREVVLRLADFRSAPGDVNAGFDDVRRIRVQWDEGGSGSLRLDEMTLVPGTRGPASASKSPEDWARVVWPKGAGTFTSKHFLLVTDVDPLRPKAPHLLARLEEAQRLLADRYLVPGRLDGDLAPLVVVWDQTALKEVVGRLAEHYGAEVAPPNSQGYTVFGVAIATYDTAQGWDRPVYVHEATHALAERVLRIQSNGNWVQEGLASAVQARMHPKSLKVDLKKAFQGLDTGKGPFVPWETLFKDAHPPMARYAELLTVVDFLAEKHKDKLAAIWEALRRVDAPLHETGAAAIAKVLGTTPTDLEGQWRAWGSKLR